MCLYGLAVKVEISQRYGSRQRNRVCRRSVQSAVEGETLTTLD
jgi:hypothetical protein